jgi:hypothetical protein
LLSVAVGRKSRYNSPFPLREKRESPRFFLEQNLLDGHQHPPLLLAVRFGNRGTRCCIMSPYFLGGDGAGYRGGFNELRPGADDGGDFHEKGNILSVIFQEWSKWGLRMDLSVTDFVATNFNKIYRTAFHYLENNSVGITYRESIVLFEISLQPMSLKSFVEDVFFKDGKSLPQMLFLLLREPGQILVPVFFENAVIMY